MITVIVASANKALFQQLKQNIEATIGVPFELLCFDNQDGKRGICQIYNEGIRQAAYDLLCFMHEDVLIQTMQWGQIVAGIFNRNKDLGILGIAGSSYKSLTPTGWLSYSGIETEYSNLIQSFKFSDNKTMHHLKNRGAKQLATVASVDGVWLCVPKKIAAATGFDEHTFRRFHCYDIDFCLSVGCHKTIAVTFDILLHHFSEGNFDRTWILEVLKLHKKWAHHLPVYTEDFTPKQIFQIEKQSFRHFIKTLIANRFSAGVAYDVLHQNNRFLKLDVMLYLKLHNYIIRYFFLQKKPGKKE